MLQIFLCWRLDTETLRSICLTLTTKIIGVSLIPRDNSVWICLRWIISTHSKRRRQGWLLDTSQEESQNGLRYARPTTSSMIMSWSEGCNPSTHQFPSRPWWRKRAKPPLLVTNHWRVRPLKRSLATLLLSGRAREAGFYPRGGL